MELRGEVIGWKERECEGENKKVGEGERDEEDWIGGWEYGEGIFGVGGIEGRGEEGEEVVKDIGGGGEERGG